MADLIRAAAFPSRSRVALPVPISTNEHWFSDASTVCSQWASIGCQGKQCARRETAYLVADWNIGGAIVFD
jgi:hypothetical protein